MRLFTYSIFILYTISEAFTGCFSDSSVNATNETGKKGHSDSVFVLKVHEPSGLAFSSSKDALYTVSDRTGAVYRIDFTGEVLEKLPFKGHDLEGIDVDKTNGEIWLVEERKQNILHLKSNGDLIEKISDVKLETRNNSGFEGIAKNGNILYILIESNPGTLIKYNISSKNWDHHELDFAKDYSGIDYDPTDNTLWIVSHESRTLNHCTTDGKLISGQDIDVKQAEGVAVDRAAGIAWVVSDAGSKLHKITLKD
jgi:uncharacterized protein YjiK